MTDSILYYGFGGGLGHITRFRAFCNTLSIRPLFMTAIKDVATGKLKTSAEKILLLPENCIEDKMAFKKWFREKLFEEKPKRVFVDAFPGGILGELCDIQELNSIGIEYIARILKVETYKKRLKGNLPKINKIWQIEQLSDEQTAWQKSLVSENQAEVECLELEYPSSNADSFIELPEHCWLIIHSGSEKELCELWEYAHDTAVLEMVTPGYVVVGQCSRPDFLPSEIPYYSVYPVTSLLEKAEKVVSAAGFNIMHQMRNMKHKHLILPFERALDDQYLRKKISADIQDLL